MEKQRVTISFNDKNGKACETVIDGETIQFGGLKVSLKELANLLWEIEPKGYSKAINGLLFSWNEITTQAIKNGANLTDMMTTGMFPGSSDYFYLKQLSESFEKLEVK